MEKIDKLYDEFLEAHLRENVSGNTESDFDPENYPFISENRDVYDTYVEKCRKLLPGTLGNVRMGDVDLLEAYIAENDENTPNDKLQAIYLAGIDTEDEINERVELKQAACELLDKQDIKGAFNIPTCQYVIMKRIAPVVLTAFHLQARQLFGNDEQSEGTQMSRVYTQPAIDKDGKPVVGFDTPCIYRPYGDELRTYEEIVRNAATDDEVRQGTRTRSPSEEAAVQLLKEYAANNKWVFSRKWGQDASGRDIVLGYYTYGEWQALHPRTTPIMSVTGSESFGSHIRKQLGVSDNGDNSFIDSDTLDDGSILYSLVSIGNDETASLKDMDIIDILYMIERRVFKASTNSLKHYEPTHTVKNNILVRCKVALPQIFNYEGYRNMSFCDALLSWRFGSRTKSPATKLTMYNTVINSTVNNRGTNTPGGASLGLMASLGLNARKNPHLRSGDMTDNPSIPFGKGLYPALENDGTVVSKMATTDPAMKGAGAFDSFFDVTGGIIYYSFDAQLTSGYEANGTAGADDDSIVMNVDSEAELAKKRAELEHNQKVQAELLSQKTRRIVYALYKYTQDEVRDQYTLCMNFVNSGDYTSPEGPSAQAVDAANTLGDRLFDSENCKLLLREYPKYQDALLKAIGEAPKKAAPEKDNFIRNDMDMGAVLSLVKRNIFQKDNETFYSVGHNIPKGCYPGTQIKYQSKWDKNSNVNVPTGLISSLIAECQQLKYTNSMVTRDVSTYLIKRNTDQFDAIKDIVDLFADAGEKYQKNAHNNANEAGLYGLQDYKKGDGVGHGYGIDCLMLRYLYSLINYYSISRNNLGDIITGVLSTEARCMQNAFYPVSKASAAKLATDKEVEYADIGNGDIKPVITYDDSNEIVRYIKGLDGTHNLPRMFKQVLEEYKASKEYTKKVDGEDVTVSSLHRSAGRGNPGDIMRILSYLIATTDDDWTKGVWSSIDWNGYSFNDGTKSKRGVSPEKSAMVIKFIRRQFNEAIARKYRECHNMLVASFKNMDPTKDKNLMATLNYAYGPIEAPAQEGDTQRNLARSLRKSVYDSTLSDLGHTISDDDKGLDDAMDMIRGEGTPVYTNTRSAQGEIKDAKKSSNPEQFNAIKAEHPNRKVKPMSRNSMADPGDLTRNIVNNGNIIPGNEYNFTPDNAKAGRNYRKIANKGSEEDFSRLGLEEALSRFVKAAFRESYSPAEVAAMSDDVFLDNILDIFSDVAF